MSSFTLKKDWQWSFQ